MDNQPSRPQVAVAILVQSLSLNGVSQPHYLMQLRDNVPGIVYPDQWGFFGGHIEPGETPEQGVFRELEEEIGHRPAALQFFRLYSLKQVVRHVFYGTLDVPSDRLVLGEGADLKLVSQAEIKAGVAFSEALQQPKPLGESHRQVLLDFLALELPKTLN